MPDEQIKALVIVVKIGYFAVINGICSLQADIGWDRRNVEAAMQSVEGVLRLYSNLRDLILE